MKDNYSWLDLDYYIFCSSSCANNADPADGGGYCSCGAENDKQTIISQIEIEKLRARIEECQLWIDDFEQDFVNYNEEPKGSLVLKPTSVDRYIALDSIKEEIARLTEKLKELRR